ncbi:MAG: hypothetical protein MOIL_00797 [Candidatus Methanolliviera sp. GoM_oil]|jgi:hypothetical protein|nr:MAG: hypothetical protein MOIL_00797 [Candidatus Methanolliviera sp. GoM_oil]
MSKSKLEIDMPSELLFLLLETEESFKGDVENIETAIVGTD